MTVASRFRTPLVADVAMPLRFQANFCSTDGNIPEEAMGAAAAAAAAAKAAAASGTSPTTVPEQEPARVEPTLEDLDLSIPQVDCKFLADLVRLRRRKKAEFDDKRSEVLEYVEETMTKLGVEMSADEELKVVNSLEPQKKEIATHFRPEYDDGFVLIDTRTVNEVGSWGAVEGSKILPAHEMWDAFHLTPEEFEVAYGFPKPHPEQTIIFICQFGPRSLMAAQILTWMGYPKVLHFRDGFFEWAKQFQLLLRMTMTHDRDSGNDVRRRAAFEAAREMQRAIAPEFNALPIQEASKYVIDETRSLGAKRVGEGVREEAIKRIEEQKRLLLGGVSTEGLLEPTKQSALQGFIEKEAGIADSQPAGPGPLPTSAHQ